MVESFGSATSDGTPLNANGYTREECFIFLTMQIGKPPRSVAARYRDDPGLAHLVAAEKKYFNDLTSWLMKLLPERSIADIVELRRHFYQHHGVLLFDAMANEYDFAK